MKIWLTTLFGFAALAALAQPAGLFEGMGMPGTSQAAPVQQAASGQAAPAQPRGLLESSLIDKNIDKVFDVKTDSFDIDSGTLTWKGKNFNIGDSKLVRSRFERYLAMDTDVKDFNSYQAILAEISSLLSASNDDISDDTLRHAWNRLFDAAEYPFDSDMCVQIANCVYTSWRMKDEYDAAKRNELDDILKVQADKFYAKAHSIYAENAKRSNLSGLTVKQRAVRKNESEHAAEIAARLVELQESKAKLALSTAEREAVALKAVLFYQSQIVMFLTERKFQAAQLASMFYRHIYRGKVQNMQVGEKELAQMVPLSQFTPNIDMVEGLANEARHDIKNGMNAVNSLYDSGDRFGALERLQETFVLGEFDPVLQVFDSSKRRVLHKIYKNVVTMKKLSESRDWDGIEKILTEMQTDAPDFPATEVLSKVRTAKRASDMHLLAAKQAAASNDTEQVKASISEAMKAWPLNPKIEVLNNELVGLSTGSIIYERKFDELWQRKNYRDIAAEAPEFGLALRNDKERLANLRKAVSDVGRIDAMLAQAKEMAKQKNPYFAWDILENAKNIDAKDVELARFQAELAPEVSDYVKALNDAQKAEAAGNNACALNFYLAAQQIFPASQTCRLGIERTSLKYAK